MISVASPLKAARRRSTRQSWVEAYARNHSIPIEWAEKGVRKEDQVLPLRNRMARRDGYGYFIFKSMEMGTPTASACHARRETEARPMRLAAAAQFAALTPSA